MKKLFLLLLISIFMTSCYDDYRIDYDYTTVAFSSADGGSGSQDELWRTVVKGEGLNLDFGVYLAGVIENKQNRTVKYTLDTDLLTGTDYELLPADYYTLSNPEEFVIPSGNIIGTINIKLDSLKFLADPLTTTAHYALPFRLTETTADSILSSRDTKILVLKYINKYAGYYEQEATYTTYNMDGTERQSGSLSNLISSTTVNQNKVLTDGALYKGPDYMMNLNVLDDNSVQINYFPNPNPIKDPQNIAITDADVELSTSYVSSWEDITKINDGYDPTSSTDKNTGAYGNYPNAETWNWVQYDFGENVYNISLSEIYWWTDFGGVLISYDTYLQYWNLDTQAWVRVEEPVGTSANKYNANVLEILTNKVRMNFIAEESQGILEWKVWGLPVPIVEEQSAHKTITAIPGRENSYDDRTSTYTLNYRVDYDQDFTKEEFYTEVSTKLVWRNRIRDGVNEWRR